MGKQNYRESVEKDRQEIAVERGSAPSRRAQRNAVKEKPKKTKNMLLPALFFIFILIPVTILFYVAFLFEPDDTLPTDETANEVSVESGSASPDTAAIPGEDEEQDETSAADEQAEKEAAAKAKTEKEAAAKAQAEKEAAAKAQAEKEAAAKAQAEKEAAAKAQAEKEAAARAQAEKEAAARAQAEAAAKAQAEKEAAQKPTPPASSKSHTVQAGETLYRIAVNTYGAAGASAGVEKIKQANGLPSNEISVGQTLVLP